ncbi:MAG: hypothetical protein WB809_00215 [Thermoplasmata archaeon]
MELISAPPASEGPPGSDPTPRPQDRNPRTAIYTDVARQRATDRPVIWDPRDFGDYETSQSWWTSVAVYGGLIFAFGSLQEAAGFSPLVTAILGLGSSVFIAILVLILIGMEVGLAVFVAGLTLLAASLSGLATQDPVPYWWAIFTLVLLGAACLAAGMVRAIHFRGLSLGDEDSRASATV